jgi:aspartokinase-like uncharacterized kinase
MNVSNNSATRHPPTRVVKFGGSLLSAAQCVEWWQSWFAGQQPCATLVIAGGGTMADAVRTLDERYDLPSHAADKMAIRAMQLNTFLLCHLLGDCRWIERLADWPYHAARCETACGMLDPLRFAQEVRTADPRRLPIGWHVTSDSIAACLANAVGATELVLLKSTLPAGNARTLTCSRAIESGFVDPYFADTARQLRQVRAVNLRDPAFRELRLV